MAPAADVGEGERMKISDARPRDVLRDKDGDIWAIDDNGDAWSVLIDGDFMGERWAACDMGRFEPFEVVSAGDESPK